MKMKNKRVEQIEAKKQHRKQLKLKRRNEPVFERNEPSLQEKPTILIVCEGENTEPSYFRQFRLSTATIKPTGEGYNTLSLVNRAAELAKEKDYEQVWCVFDKDDFDNNDFNNAIVTAEAQSFGVAYSNQAFEYWIILHFDDHQGGGMHRKDYNKKINTLLDPFNLSYDGEGSKIITEEIFEVLDGIDNKTNKERKVLAIQRAKKNYNQFEHINPATEESSTTIFRLIETLLKYT
ncbi:MAG TPA: RloB family protein [Agriterribacter sp.]|nr:RloB family protein [Agriterribacter sp.]HRQ49875.1 RloB family protein [Agriterribacter sp.]